MSWLDLWVYLQPHLEQKPGHSRCCSVQHADNEPLGAEWHVNMSRILAEINNLHFAFQVTVQPCISTQENDLLQVPREVCQIIDHVSCSLFCSCLGRRNVADSCRHFGSKKYCFKYLFLTKHPSTIQDLFSIFWMIPLKENQTVQYEMLENFRLS